MEMPVGGVEVQPLMPCQGYMKRTPTCPADFMKGQMEILGLGQISTLFQFLHLSCYYT